MADVTLSSIRGEPRRAIYTLTASDASFPIPAWAQGGKGIVYVTGCGGGAGGAVGVTNGQRGNGGAAGGFAVKHPIPIPNGITTASAVIGAGGAGRNSTTLVQSNSGGATKLTLGSVLLTLEGGSHTAGGYAYMGDNPVVSNSSQSHINSGATTTGFQGADAPASTLSKGISGPVGSSGSSGYGAGGYSLFGQGGIGRTTAPTGTAAGDDATGYGAGGAGAVWIDGVPVSSGSGSQGILILEFVEGF